MAKVTMNGKVIAESNKTIEVEGNLYFPANSVKTEFFKKTDTHTICPWKGEASYYTIEIDGEIAKDEAWFYPEPLPKAEKIKNYIAFYGNKTKIE